MGTEGHLFTSLFCYLRSSYLEDPYISLVKESFACEVNVILRHILGCIGQEIKQHCLADTENTAIKQHETTKNGSFVKR